MDMEMNWMNDEMLTWLYKTWTNAYAIFHGHFGIVYLHYKFVWIKVWSYLAIIELIV